MQECLLVERINKQMLYSSHPKDTRKPVFQISQAAGRRQTK